MNRQIIEPDVTLRVAYEDHDSVVKLIGELVRIPSRAGTDPCGPMLDACLRGSPALWAALAVS